MAVMNRGRTSEGSFIEKVIFINRVTKVTKGGKNLGFTALVVVGDGLSKAGFALGKANEVADAIRKGIKRAKKRLVDIKKRDTTIPHEVHGKFGAVEIFLKPARRGTGVIASSSVRAICECAGIKDILTKILKKSTNPVNVVKAAFSGLESIKFIDGVEEIKDANTGSTSEDKQ
ncbi:MAG: 30S ribosomal protein S5 [Candidatus Omnitrophica bacterium 4484_171]|nr:MAG: 30S ribosomal protein S5 [Candidatus Omnitrophica bacterium 4484_171]